jgi:peroxiredoxin
MATVIEQGQGKTMSEATRVRAPELPVNLEWFNTDGPLTLQAQRGKAVLLVFWTSSSINCQHVLPDLHYLQRKYPDTLSVIVIHTPRFASEQRGTQVQKAVNRHHLRYPVASDPKFQLWRAYGVKAWPTCILIDPEGYVIGSMRGEGRRKQIDDLIAEHIALAEAKGVLVPSPTQLAKKSEVKSELSFPGRVLATRNNLYISDSGRNRVLETYHDGKIRRVFGCGTAGLLDGTGESAMFDTPQGLVLVGDFLYVADTANHAIRRIHLKSGDILTIAGTGKQGRYKADSFRDPLQAELNSPRDLACHESTLYIAMAGQHQIWHMNLNHLALERYAGSGRGDLVDGALERASFAQPSGVEMYNGSLLVVDAESSALRSINLASGTVSTLVGLGLFDFGDREGVGSDARLQFPMDVAVDEESRTAWLVDTFNSKIKRVDLAGKQVTKFRISYELDEPRGLSIYRDKLFIANTNAHEILVLDINSRIVEVVNVRQA